MKKLELGKESFAELLRALQDLRAYEEQAWLRAQHTARESDAIERAKRAERWVSIIEEVVHGK